MAGKNTAVFGIYPTRTSAENAVDALKAANFRNADISVLLPEGPGTKDFAHEKNTKAPEGATAGAGTGAVLGGGLGWLLENRCPRDSGARAIHSRGADYGGPCRSRSWRSGRWADGCLDRHGNPGVRSQAIRRPCQRWRVLLSVHSDASEWTKKAKEILERTGAQDISSTGEASADKSDKPRVREVA